MLWIGLPYSDVIFFLLVVMYSTDWAQEGLSVFCWSSCCWFYWREWNFGWYIWNCFRQWSCVTVDFWCCTGWFSIHLNCVLRKILVDFDGASKTLQFFYILGLLFSIWILGKLSNRSHILQLIWLWSYNQLIWYVFPNGTLPNFLLPKYPTCY